MAWKHWRVLDSETVHTNDDTTYRVKLPGSNILHSILVRCRCTNGATNNQGNGLTDAVDWIKVIADGSRVLFHLEPETIRMLSLFNGMGDLYEYLDEYASIVQQAWYPIPFGRGFYDPLFYLDLSKFSDVELQIKYSPTIAATGWVTGTFTTTVLGLMTLDGTPGPYNGSLVTRIIENFTTAASGDKVVEPPTRWPYRALLVRCYEAAVADGTDITDVQFDVNNEQRVPLKMSWSELKGLNQLLTPIEIHRARVLDRTDADTVPTLLSDIRQVILKTSNAGVVAADTFEVVAADLPTTDTLTLDMNQADITAGAETFLALATDEKVYCDIRAQGLPFAVYVPLHVGDEPPYFDPTVWDDVKLTLTQGGAGGDADVVLQEVQAF